VTQPTAAEWAEIATALDRQLAPIYLCCDGYLVEAELTRTGKNTLGITVAVNGWSFRGSWLPLDGREMSEEARRFWCPRKRQRMSAKHLRVWEKLYGKRECRRRGYYEPVISPFPVWRRPRPFIAHLKAHNTNIEIIDYTRYKTALTVLRSTEDGKTTNA